MAITNKAMRIGREKRAIVQEIKVQRRHILEAVWRIPQDVRNGSSTKATQWRDAAERAHAQFAHRAPVTVNQHSLSGLQDRLAAERAVLDSLRGEQPFILAACNG